MNSGERRTLLAKRPPMGQGRLRLMGAAATLLLGEEAEPTEGVVLFQDGERLVLQLFDAVGDVVPSATLVPDASGMALTTSRRLAEMSKAGASYTLGPAERLLPGLEAGQSGDRDALEALVPTSVLTPLWQDDLTARRQKLATLVIELLRGNKRILLVAPDYQSADAITLLTVRAMKAAGLTFKSWLSRYEVATSTNVCTLADSTCHLAQSGS